MRSTFTFGLLAVAGFSAAQEQYTIDPDTVQQSTRSYWCDQQKASCPQICLQQPGVSSMNTVSNECDSDTLVASCVCDNGISPNLTQYTQTLPYNICQQWGTNCVAGCGIGENACADSCRKDHPCGAQDPFKGNATKSSSSASHASTSKPTGTSDSDSSASSTLPATGFAGQTTSPDSAGAASTLVGFGASYGMAVTLVGIFASLTLL
ncbi:uncharacterized protein CC84DRAFT_1085127 [Paraphaeosphaeria sporulosa]|uniref:DUF7707 domain-containing protein n=1 Tax=Paraphaeosphaeria sporulosa TaxID=1460663 RepID=A0A177CNX3_9PLEO|nr:uncharacterized protein CC84DRAFT_1085127 [Paraphaeosphaeria sporulosa]OAG08682.1 hypothetical protein CC84DRAFT_1085127 [Paraphaeosphaeria sporulosa]